MKCNVFNVIDFDKNRLVYVIYEHQDRFRPNIAKNSSEICVSDLCACQYYCYNSLRKLILMEICMR